METVAAAALRGRGEREHEDFLSRGRTDVVMHAHRLLPRGIANERLEQRLAGNDQMATKLLEQFCTAAVAFAMRIHQPLLRGCQHTLQMNEEFVFDQVSVHMPRAATHEFLLEPRHGVTDCGLDLSLRFQCMHGGNLYDHDTPLERGFVVQEEISS